MPEDHGEQRPSRQASWEEARRDALFLKDIEEIEQAFLLADAETIRDLDAPDERNAED